MSSSATASAATDAAEQALVDRYAAAVAPIASRVVGRLRGAAPTVRRPMTKAPAPT